MLFLILAESALETVPASLQSAPAILKIAKKRKKEPSKLILDSSLFPHLVRKLPMGERRGRPDIVHISLLCALRTPLNMEGQLKVYVHTLNDKVIEVNPEVRLPRNYNRFVGLMEQLYEHRQVPLGSTPLLTLKDMTLPSLMKEINPERVILFCEEGVRVRLDEYMRSLSSLSRVAAIVGGFPHGSFFDQTESLADEKISIYDKPLDAWTVVSRVIYCYELATIKLE
ncbi:MAG: 16S rRNA methyltransferase [Candidatus Freyarchaeota archaeon]|nr:16S rRNA methyltransferase [Candidatus Jordarchaeia archaeon]